MSGPSWVLKKKSTEEKERFLLMAIVLQFPPQFYFSDHSLVLKKKEILFVANLFQLFLKTYLQTLAELLPYACFTTLVLTEKKKKKITKIWLPRK